MIRPFVRAAVLAVTVVLGACASSPPMHFYTLARIAPDSRAAVPAGALPIRLDRVTVPGELDRMQLVQQIDATRLHVFDQDRWAAPLDEMIARVLSADLAARLPPGLLADPATPERGDRRSLSVDIQDFSMDAGCSVTLRADWTLVPAGTRFTRYAGRVSSGADGASGSAAGRGAAVGERPGFSPGQGRAEVEDPGSGGDESSTSGTRQASEEVHVSPAGACGGVGSQAELMSRALAGLADRIAAAVAR